MAFPQIGLEAVLKIQDFERNAAAYIRKNDEMAKKTQQTANAIAKASKTPGDFALDLTGKYKQMTEAAAAAGEKSEAAGMRMVRGLKDVGSIAAGVAASIVGIGVALNKALEAGEQAAAIEDMKQSFLGLAAGSGISAEKLISDLRAVSRSTISTVALIKTANSALLAGGAEMAADLPRLYQIAEAAARATGQDVEYVYTTLIRGINKASPLLIDNAEVYIKVGQAVEEYAAQLGKSADALTTEERRTATRNAILEQGAGFIEKAGGSAERATDPFRQLDVQMQQFSTGLKTVTLPVTEWLTKSLGGLLTAAKGGIAAIAGWLAVVDQFGSIIKGDVRDIDVFRAAFDKTFQTLTTGTAAIEDTESGIDKIGDAAADNAAKVADLNKKLAELAQRRADKLADMAKQAARQDQDDAIQRRRQQEDDARSLARQRQDTDRSNAEARERIEKDSAKRIAEVEVENRKKSRDLIAEQLREREDLQRQHQERLFQINQKASDTISEAARRNDAVAIAEALRSKQRELRDAQRESQIEKAEMVRDQTLKQQQIDADNALSLQKARQAADEQLIAQQEAEAEQEESLRLSLRRQDEDRRIAYLRQQQDRALARARQMEDLNEWYAEEQDKLKEQMTALTAIAVTGVTQAGGAIGKAASDAISKIATSTLGWSPEEQWRQRGNVLGSETAPKLSEKDQWLKRHQFMAEGGMDIVDRPTRFVAGEAGPELAAFVPLRRNNLTIGGNIGVDVSGPGTAGMDTASMQAVVYQAMVKVAQRIAVTR